MKLLYATNNTSKIYNMKRRLNGLPIELITPRELGLKLTINEDGITASENALKKALAHYNATKLPTIAGDSGLYIENITEDKQPGLFVRRVNGFTLTDEEMIAYNTNLVKSIGGYTFGFYITGLALVTNETIASLDINEDKFILTSHISSTPHRGNPLDVMTIDPTTKKYYTEMSDEEFMNLNQTFDIECLKFIKNNLIKEDIKTLQLN